MYKSILVFLLSVFFIGCGGSADSSKQETTVESLPATSKPSLPEVSLVDKTQRIVAFIQLTNQVRYFHPSDGASQTKWDDFTSYGIYRTAITTSQEDFIATLRALFATMAPNLKINGQGSIEGETLNDTDTITFWSQTGYVDAKDMNNSVYKRVRDQRGLGYWRNLYNLDTNYQASLASSIDIDLPIILAMQGSKTLPESKALIAGIQDYEIDTRFTNSYARLAAAGQLWAVLQHFYPYLDELDLNWSNELSPLIDSCIESTENCGMAMRKLLTKTGDNHNYLSSQHTELGNYTLPVSFAWLENKAVVINKTDETLNVEVGDQLIAVNGIDIDSIILEKSAYSLRAENKQKSLVVAYELLRGQQGQEVTLTLKNVNEIEYQITMFKTENAIGTFVATRSMLSYENSDKHRIINDNIHYVNVSELEGSDVNAIINLIDNAKAIVLDLRTYPNWQSWRGFLAHFIDQPIHSLPMNKYQYSYPNQHGSTLIDVPQELEPATSIIDVPVIALASRYSISQNEHALGYVQDANIPILGENTYGINGNVTRIYLLGGAENTGLEISITGMKVTQHDGSLLRGVGIVPDIAVPLTIDAIKKGEDIQLQAAIDYLQLQL